MIPCLALLKLLVQDLLLKPGRAADGFEMWAVVAVPTHECTNAAEQLRVVEARAACAPLAAKSMEWLPLQ